MQVGLSLVPPQETLRDIRQSHGAELGQNQFVARPDFGIRGANEALGVLSPSASPGFWCLPGGMSCVGTAQMCSPRSLPSPALQNQLQLINLGLSREHLCHKLPREGLRSHKHPPPQQGPLRIPRRCLINREQGPAAQGGRNSCRCFVPC